MAKSRNGKIRKYRKPLNINIGMIIFGIIFVYIIIGVVMYFTSETIIPYEVKAGSLSTSNVYQGLAIRDEEVVTGTDSGYINYYAREGERVGVGSLVYTIDESGDLTEKVKGSGAGENTLTDSDLSELRTQITGFYNEFSETEFRPVYDFKHEVEGTVLKLANQNMLENIDTLSGGLVNLKYAKNTGVIVYSTDGYEKLRPEDVTKDMFDTKAYKKTQLANNQLVGSGDVIYKLATEENWSLMIPVEEDRAVELEEAEYVRAKFLKTQQSSWAEVVIHHNADGTYAQLIFNNSMLTFCTDRHVDIELYTTEDVGLKIPNSSIVEKEFFLIPTEYITKGGSNSLDGVMRERYAEDGSVTTEFVETTIYNEEDGEYYLDGDVLRIGEYLIMPDTAEKYAVSKRGSLIGVYNINKGYADFKRITILYQNDEYSIVQSNTEYGLSVYDHIVLEANSVLENEFIYE